MTGASGALYGVRFLERACNCYERVYLAVSEQASQVGATGLDRPAAPPKMTIEWLLGRAGEEITPLDRKGSFSPTATGSVRAAGMGFSAYSRWTAGGTAK